MLGATGRSVRFEGATGNLRGRVDLPGHGAAWGAVVLCHGRHEDMDAPLLTAIARTASSLGLWTLRFNFAFQEARTEPSAGHEDEIADLREAVAYARHESRTKATYIAGRGVGAWATVAAATDAVATGGILLGLSYQGQPGRRMALERLGEFEIPTLMIVGFESDRLDLPALRDLVASMPEVDLKIIAGADHRLEDAAGRPMIDAVVRACEVWLKVRKEGDG